MSEAPPAHWFTRQDESADENFYAMPRMVAHIDDATIAALRLYYEEFLSNATHVLDLMSSWISHYPETLDLEQTTGLGMNAEELAANPQLTDWLVHNLNEEPTLPFPDDLYDRATIAVSIQYLKNPVPVMKELQRVLKPGGQLCIAMSHRLFPTKAVAAFVQLPAEERIRLVMYYLSEGGFKDIEFIDRSPQPPGSADPLWLVVGTA